MIRKGDIYVCSTPECGEERPMTEADKAKSVPPKAEDEDPKSKV
jgi:hypothetical protein